MSDIKKTLHNTFGLLSPNPFQTLIVLGVTQFEGKSLVEVVIDHR